MTTKSLSNAVMSGLRWSIMTRLLTQAFTWGATLFIFRSISPTELGLVTLSGVVTQYALLVSEMGLSSGIVQQRISDRETLAKAFGAVLAWSLGVFALLVFFAPVFSRLLAEPSTRELIQISALQFLFIPFGVIPQAALLMQDRFKEISLVNLLANLIGSATTLCLAISGWGAKALIIGPIAIVATRAIGLNARHLAIYIPSFQWRGLSRLFNTSGLLLIDRTIWHIQSSIDSVIIGRVLGAPALGPYSLSMQIASIPTERAAEAISLVALPTFSKIQDQPGRLRDAYLRALSLGATVAFPLFWGAATISSDLVRLAFGARWVDAAPMLAIICVTMPLRVIAPIGPPAVTA